MSKQGEISKIAKEVLGIQTLQRQGRDRLDFHDISVWNIQAALEKAYEAGVLNAEEKITS
jgi:hypothetical protein